MFSTTQMELIAPLVQSMYEQGYEYYVVHTNTNLDSSYNNYDYADLTFYFSDSPIECTGYTFSSTGSIVQMDAVTRNVSNSTNDNKVERLQKQELSSMSVYVDSYEHIMTNAEDSMFANVLAMTEYTNANDVSYNVDVNHFFALHVLLGVLIIMEWLRVWFARNYGGKNE